MHNGKNIPHSWTENNETRASRGCRAEQIPASERSTGVARPPALLAERSLGTGRRRRADRDTSDCTSGSWQVVASPSSPRLLAGVRQRVTGPDTPLLGVAFSPTGSLAQVRPLPFFLRFLAEEKTASHAGPD